MKKTLIGRFPRDHLKLLGSLTLGHGTNDFYNVLIPILLPPIAAAFDLSYTQSGLFILLTKVMSGPLQPVLGLVADRHGWQKGVILTGLAAFGLGLVAISLSSTLGILLIAGLIYGFGETTFHPQSTNYITSTFKENKGKAMGFHGLGGSLGNFVAPAVGALLITKFGWQNASRLLAVPAALALILLWFNLRNRQGRGGASLFASINRDLILLGINFGLISMLYRGFSAFLPTWLVENQVSLAAAGGVASLMLLVGIVAQPTGGALFDRFGGRIIFILSPLIAGSALLAMTLVRGWLVVPFILVIGAAVTATFPVVLTMASVLAPEANIGVSVGVTFGVSTIMASATPLVTGFLADRVGLTSAFQLLLILPLLAVVMALLSAGDRPRSALRPG